MPKMQEAARAKGRAEKEKKEGEKIMITFADEPPERCAICKLYLLRHHREQWISLVPADDGDKVWLCKKCFNIPVEDFFIPKDYERRKPVGLMWPI